VRIGKSCLFVCKQNVKAANPRSGPNFSELGTLEWDTIDPDCLIRISNVDTYDFLLNPLFFGKSRKKSKTGFLKLRVLPFSLYYNYINLKWRAKFQIDRLLIRDPVWLNFIHFSGYKYKIRLVSI